MPDDQDNDPAIAEALSAVTAQFAGVAPPDAARTLDAASLPYDDETDDASPSDDPNAEFADDSTDDDTLTAADADDDATAPAIDWDADDNPYKAQAIEHGQRVQQFEQAIGLVQRINAMKQAQAEEADAQALVAQLAEIDPQMAETYSGQRQGLIQRTQGAEREKVAWTHSMAAMTMAMKEVLDEETFERIRSLGEEIVQKPGLDGMQNHLATKRQATTSADKRVAELEEALRLALLQQGARQRPAAADRVDSAPAARARVTRPEDADDMDGFFAAWQPDLDAHFGKGRAATR